MGGRDGWVCSACHFANWRSRAVCRGCGGAQPTPQRQPWQKVRPKSPWIRLSEREWPEAATSGGNRPKRAPAVQVLDPSPARTVVRDDARPLD
eukprot:190820-Alexandrium_andersonii.AAC.1